MYMYCVYTLIRTCVRILSMVKKSYRKEQLYILLLNNSRK